MFRVISGLSLALLVAVLCAGSAAGSGAWSRPIVVDRSGGNQFGAVSCPSAAQCTGADDLGQEVTFDPQAPKRTWRHLIGIPLDEALACPSTAFCVGVLPDSLHSRAVVFEPKSGRVLRRWRIALSTDPFFSDPNSVTCVSVNQCTAVGTTGHQATFDPRTGKNVSTSHLGDFGLTAVSCPSKTQCTAIRGPDSTGELQGYEVTFDPVSGAAITNGITFVGGQALQAMSCPSTSQCTAVNHYGHELTFDPVTAQVNAAGDVTLAANEDLLDISCRSVTQCTAVASRGHEITFDPTTGLANDAGVAKIGTGGATAALSCPTDGQCTAVGNGKEVTFAPATGTQSTARFIDRGGDLFAVVCPSATECVVRNRTTEFTLDLGGVRVRVHPHTIDPGGRSGGLSCPSATQCTMLDSDAHEELTFDPRTGKLNAAGARVIEPNGYPGNLSCPTTTKCVAIDDVGREVTFDPSTGVVITQARQLGSIQLSRVACASVDQCTAVASQQEVTFDPRPSGVKIIKTASLDVPGINGFACPSTTECVAVASFGDEVAFHPRTGRLLGAGDQTIDKPVQLMTGLSCMTVHTCIATDTTGGTLTFNPVSPGRPARVVVPHGPSLTGVACTPTGRCVAIDDGGNAYVRKKR